HVKIDIGGRSKVKLNLANSKNGEFTTGAETLGASLAVAHTFLPEEKSQLVRARLLEPLLKLLAITGFRQAGGSIFPSLLFPLDGKRDEVFNIKDLLKGKTSFAVPDTVKVPSGGMIMKRKGQTADASAEAQAELLRGIS